MLVMLVLCFFLNTRLSSSCHPLGALVHRLDVRHGRLFGKAQVQQQIIDRKNLPTLQPPEHPCVAVAYLCSESSR